MLLGGGLGNLGKLGVMGLMPESEAINLAPIYAMGAAHLDASQITSLTTDGSTPVASDGDVVGQINDKSGNAYHYSQATAANKPLYKTGIRNGKSVIRFDGSNDYLSGLKAGLSKNKTKFHIIAVVNLAVITGTRPIAIFSQGTSGGARALMHCSSSSLLANSRRADNEVSTNISSPTLTAGWQISHAYFDYAEGFQSVYVNGAFSGASKMTSTGATSNTDEVNKYLGTDTAGASWLNGDIGEMFVVPASLTDAELAPIYDYLAAKWAVTAEHPKLYDPSKPLQAGWTWFNDPRVIAISSTRFALGGVDRAGDIITQDINSGVRDGTVVQRRFEIDDHVNPAIIKRASDNKLMVFFTNHSNTSNMWYAISSAANDATNFGTVTNIGSQLGNSNFSYANVIQLDSGRIYLFFRATNTVSGDWAWHYSYSDNDGVTWVSAVQLSGDERPYPKLRKNGANRIDIITNDGHPDVTANNNTYHYYLLDTAGTISFHKTDGTDIGAPPFSGADLTLLYDGDPDRSWVWDVVIRTNPVAAFATFPGSTGSEATDHRHRQGRWNGSAWSTEEICAAGGGLYADQDYYSGGVITDPDDEDVVYCSRQVDGSGNLSASGVWQIFKADRVSEGNWTLTQLTFGSYPAFRPYVPEGGRKLFYMTGRYTTYSSFDPWIESLDI